MNVSATDTGAAAAPDEPFLTRPTRVIADADLTQPSLSNPDGAHVVWPIPRDPKLDTQRLLRRALDGLGLTDVVVSTSGSFTLAQLQDETNASVPYVTVIRAGDTESELGLGQRIGAWPAGSPGLVDQGLVDPETDVPTNVPTVPSGGLASVYGSLSTAQISVTISDKNGHRADQMYVIVKTIMLAAKREFFRVGYLKLLRTSGEDGTDLQINATTPSVVFTRMLSFEFVYPDAIVAIDTAVDLVAQTLDDQRADITASL